MSSLTKAIAILVLLPSTPALATPLAGENSTGLTVWIFLGFAALIVVAQLVPVIMVMLGMVKGITKKRTGAFENSSTD